MALIRDYEIHGTGFTVPSAYHVVTNVKVEKRMHDIPAPPDPSRPDGLTEGSQDPEKAVYWKKGYIGHIVVTIWASKEAREEGKKPIGFMGAEPTETEFEGNIGTPGMDHKCLFFLDVNNGIDYTTQAYEYLRTLDYYQDAVVD